MLIDLKKHSTTFHENMGSKAQEQSGEKENKKKRRGRGRKKKRRKKGKGKSREKEGKKENSILDILFTPKIQERQFMQNLQVVPKKLAGPRSLQGYCLINARV